MPPPPPAAAPFRHPSQPGASVATKRAFKPPGPAKAGASSSSSATSGATRTTTTTAWSKNPTGFTSAAAQLDDPDLEAMIITDDEDEDDDFGAAITAAEKRKTTATATSRDANVAAAATTKRPRTRLPSLSPMTQSSPPRAPSPFPAAPPTTTPAPTTAALDDEEIPLLPSALITRLLHESFRDKDVKIGKEANVLMARYLDVFVREAVARAGEVVGERRAVGLAAGDGGEEEGEGDVWLDVADLEEVAPGLVLDF